MTTTPSDPLLVEDESRLLIHPVKYKDVFEFYKKAEAALWTSAEVQMDKDAEDWKLLQPNERRFLKYVLAFFALADKLVNANLIERFLTEVKMPEAVSFYTAQIYVEQVHSEVYSMMIQNIITDSVEREQLLVDVTELPSNAAKREWILRWTEDEESSFYKRLIAFAAVEGIFFSGSFAAIFWIRQRNILNGLTDSNKWIARDEALHMTFACHLYRNYCPEQDKLPRAVILEIVESAIEAEHSFMREAITDDLIDMSADKMLEYIQFVADRLLVELGEEKHYFASNPFVFMNNISLECKTNFFEKKPTEYNKTGTGDNNDYTFNLLF